ncbi:MAG: hypothetical protein R3C59_24135 [Planctomycetaceae bacterium]
MSESAPLPDTFEQLAASRRHWIDTVLRPWCQRATLKQLRQVEVEWLDIAGRVDVKATLWTWAWERFPALTHPEMSGVNETSEVQISLQNGQTYRGFPDSRQSLRGMLTLIGLDLETSHSATHGPFSIDDVVAVSSSSSGPPELAGPPESSGSPELAGPPESSGPPFSPTVRE